MPCPEVSPRPNKGQPESAYFCLKAAEILEWGRTGVAIRCVACFLLELSLCRFRPDDALSMFVVG